MASYRSWHTRSNSERLIMLFKIAIFTTLLGIAFQDTKERAVYWWLFVSMAIFQGIVYYSNSIPIVYFTNITINLCLVFFIILVLFIYSKLKLKVSFFKEAFGVGDLCFLIALAVSFPIYTFIIILAAALIFSLIVSLITLKQKQTVPLAGFMSLFLVIIYTASWIMSSNINLYTI